jgi:hypothetical protein
VSGLGKFSPFGCCYFLALADYFQGKNRPMIKAIFWPKKIIRVTVWVVFVVIGRFFHKTSGHPDFG